MRLPAGIAALVAALVFSSCGSPSASRTERAAALAAVRTFQRALNQGSAAALDAAVCPDLRVGGLPAGMSLEGLRAGLSSRNGRINDVQILSLRRMPDGLEGTVGLYLKNSAVEMKMGFAPDGRIRSIGSDPGPAKASARVPDVMTSAFLEVDGLMYVRAEADGRKGFFLVDSGSSEMLLNRRYFTADGTGSLFQISAGVHGVKPPSGEKRVGAFRWETMRGEGIVASVTDLSNLEKPANTPLLGAVGYAQMRDSAMVVDWKARRIQFFATRRDGARKVPEPVPAQAEIPFTYDYHMPVFPGTAAGRTRKFLFDSGASVNLLPDTGDYGSHFRRVGAGAKLSDGGQIRETSGAFGVMDEIVIGDVLLRDAPVLVHTIPHLEGRGLLGTPILREGRFEINFRARVMRFWR